MKILVCGFGLIGKQRAAAMSADPGVERIDVYDPRFEPGTILDAKTTAIARGTIGDTAYDAAIVATPHDTAVEIVPAVVHAAPHVLVEKPLGRTADEGAAMIAAARAAGARLSVGLNYRFLRNVSALRDAYCGGALGRLLGLDAVLAHGAEPGYERGWKTDRAKCGGGVVIDPGVHLFDLVTWLFGEAHVATAALSRSFWPIEVEDHASVALAFADGAIGSIVLSISSWRSRLEITCEFEHAQVILQGRGKFYGSQRLTTVTRWPWLAPTAPREETRDFGSDDASLREETMLFLDVARGARPQGRLATADQALRAMRIVDDCYRLAAPLAERSTPV